MRRFLVFLVILSLVFMISCGDKSSDSGKLVNDEDQTEITDEDSDTGDTEEPDEKDDSDDIDISDEDSDTGDTEEPDEKDDSDNIDISDIEISDEDSDNIETPDETPDTDTPVNPEATENHKISGTVQAVSATAVALMECGKTDKIVSAETDANGKFSFEANISAAKTYCVKAGDFASCFKGASDHVANISEITTAAYLLDKNCTDIRKSETKIRTYAKLGTGEWLGELDYSKLSGISEGFKLLSSFIGSSDAKTLSEKIAEDAEKEAPEFENLFNGFRISLDKNEIIIGETSDSNANFSIEGGSATVAPNFKINWILKNNSAEAATYKFTTSNSGEYTARAKLVSVSGNNALSQDSATVLFMQRKSGGTVYVSDNSKNISFRIDDGIYGVIPKGTIVKKDGAKINSISYDILSAGGNQVSRLKFRPEGATFEGDTMYFVHELGTVFGGDPQILTATRTNADGSIDVMNSAAGDPIMMAAAGDPIMTTAAGDPIMQAAAGDPIMTSAAGDPIMTAAAGDPIMTSAAGDPIMTSAAGDPIMSAAAGDPIMTSAAGDPIMAAAAGDPIMMGTSSSTMVSQTNHYSTFTVEAANLPVSVDALVAKWCDLGSFLHLNSPVEFIRKGVEKYKPAGEEKTRLLSYLDCDHFADLGSDLYELINKPVGFNRNLNLIENIFFAAEFHERMVTKQDNAGISAFVAVKNGLELRSAIAALYTATTSYNRSATLADIFDPSMMPMTYSGAPLTSYASSAKAAIIGNADAAERYIATKKEMMIFANYITTSSKGPDFSNVEAMLTPDQLVCAWMNPDTKASNCNKVYTLNEAGHVTLGGTEVSVAEANAIFTKFFMPMNSRLNEEEKLHLFRTFYLALKYAGTIFYGGSDMDEFKNTLLKTAYLVFDGIEGNSNAVSIVDTFDASAHTVSVLDGAEMATVPYLTKLSALTDKIALKVAAAGADVEKVLINIEGREFNKVQENTRTYYKPDGSLKEKSIVLTPGTLSQGEKALKTLLGSENVDELGNITGKLTIVANSKISGKTYTTQKTYDFFVNNDSSGVNSKPVPANIQIFVNDSTGHAIPADANPGIILNPGSRVYYPANGVVSLENLTPAAYTIDAFADGYYAKNVSVNVPAGAAFSVEIRLDEELTSTADADLALSVKIETAKHPSKVYIQIYNDDMDLVANEAAKFIDEENTYETLNIALNSGRYTLLAVGDDMYNYLEAVTLYPGENEKSITVVAKNACGNGIVDSAEECEPALSAPVLCGTIYPASTYPEKEALCNPATCTFDKTQCGKAAFCGDGILDAGEGCDGGAKDCSEIAGFANARGTAPCKNDDCSGYITANNCTKTTESCGTLPANAQWNDGTGTFEQVWDGANWLPAAKAAEYGLTAGECTFSCKKGSVWDVSSGRCVLYPLSLGLICTGQTSCFDTENETECPAYGETFFGQDAQYAEVSFCTPHTFTTEGSGENALVKDAYTHYEWQAAASSAMSWSEADTYCSDLNNESTSAAQWRIPSPTELLTIVDSGSSSPALGDIFSTSEHSFWAAEDAKDSNNAWRVDENGSLANVAKTESASVICIRYQSNYSPAGERFSSEGDETVKDTESGLMWQKQPVSSSTWKEALEYCYNVSTNDKFDWRLPNRNELASLIAYTRTKGAMSSFPGVAAKGFWSSTSSVNEEEKAWTVDFASGKIETVEKNNTKYVICVRNDEPCFGDECPNACGFAPCKDMANSTGLCTASDYSFTCGCKSGFNWNHANCLLDTTRYIACTGLPENASWNTVFGISQTYDGENWYPSEVGSFNKIASSTECRFICATNYKWDTDEEKCLPVSRMTQCSEKKPYSDWNSVSKISQTWNGEKWEPSSESEYNEEPSEDECRFVCKEHYNWDNENKICAADTQEVACTGLPANAVWNSEIVTQIWNGTKWEPETKGSHTTGNATDKCYFKCIEENVLFDWVGGACTGHTNNNVHCDNDSLPANASWWNEAISQTYNGTDWLPTNSGSYSSKAVANQCRFKCNNHYSWNGETCDAEKQISFCNAALLPDNAQWNTATSITQHWDENAGENHDGAFVPTLNPEYNTDVTTTECHYICKENYEPVDPNNKYTSCKPATRTGSCTGLPDNAQWNTSPVKGQITQTWNGSDWEPTLTGVFGGQDAPAANSCIFKCADNFDWGANGPCTPRKEADVECTGLPENAEWTGGFRKITQTWNGTQYAPSNIGTYNTEADSTYCRFKCKKNYTWSGIEGGLKEEGNCVADTRVMDCGQKPENSVWNYVSSISQTWDGKQWFPKLESRHCGTIGTDKECCFICKEGYYLLGNECVLSEETCNYDPCNGVNNSVADSCENRDNPFISYSCGCKNGYYWWGKTGCRERAALGNICTNITTCYKNDSAENCPSLPLGTGTDYNFYGQDAYYAEAGFCTPHSFDNTSNNKVIDNATGLIWMNHANNTKGTWDDAKAFCESAGLRLPTVKEWMTIIDTTKSDPSFDKSYFQLTDYSPFWTMTEDAADNNKAWVLDADVFYYVAAGSYIGSPWHQKSKSEEQYYLCVSGDPLPGETPSFSQVNSEVVKDTNSKLYWQNGYAENKTWQEALEYCENLDEGGYTDWRLPNLNELVSIVDFNRAYPAVNTTYLNMPAGTEEYSFWSSSTNFFNATTAFVIDLNTGMSPLGYLEDPEDRFSSICTILKSSNKYVRCVRSDLCGSGQFLYGKNCISSPCTVSSCSMEHSDGVCIPLTSTTFSCGCADGYFWNSSSKKCVADPCYAENNECTSMEGSDKTCSLSDGKIECGCVDGYFWNGSRCMRKVFGNICTGQDTCYNDSSVITCPEEGADFFGQDAQYAAKGACTPQSYTTLIPSDMFSGEKVVRDNNTKLEWQITSPSGKYTFYEAIDYCADLKYAGYDDWRLPAPKELASIGNLSGSNPAFPGADGKFWAAKKVENVPLAVTIRGEVSENTLDSTNSVRCVRGTFSSDSSFTASTAGNGDLIYTDNVTGLMWHKSSEYKVWKEALEYCENSTYAGYTDWRLANYNELLSIVNYNKFHPATDLPLISAIADMPFGNPQAMIHSSSIYSVFFHGFNMYSTIPGGLTLETKDMEGTVLCVR